MNSCSEREWKNIYDPDSTDPSEWAPKTLVPQQISDIQLRLTWEQFDRRIDGFYLNRKIGDDEYIENFKYFDPEDRTWIDTIYHINQKQSYELFAFADQAFSSKMTLVFVPEFKGPCIQTLINISPTIVRIEWEAHTFSTVREYILNRLTIGGNLELIKQTRDLAVYDSTLDVTKTYQYHVLAVSDYNVSDVSEIFTIQLGLVGYQKYWGDFTAYNTAKSSNNGQFIASWKQDDISLFDLSSGSLLWTVDPGQYYPTDVKFGSNNEFLVSVAGERFIKAWSISDGNLLWTGEHANTANNRIYPFDISSDASKVASGDNRDGVVNVWNSSDGSLLWTCTMTGAVTSVVFSPDNTILAGGDENSVVSFWNASNGEFIKTLSVINGKISTLAFSNDGSKVVICSAEDDTWKYQFSVKDFSSGAELFSGTHIWSIPSVEFSPDDMRLVTSSYDDSLKIWDVNSGNRLYSRYGGPPVHFNADGSKIISGGNAGLRVYNTADGSLFWKSDSTGYSWNTVFIGDGSKIISASESGVMVWEEKFGWKQIDSN